MVWTEPGRPPGSKPRGKWALGLSPPHSTAFSATVADGGVQPVWTGTSSLLSVRVEGSGKHEHVLAGSLVMDLCTPPLCSLLCLILPVFCMRDPCRPDLAVVSSDKRALVAYVEVWDEDTVGADDVIGVGTLPLGDIVLANGKVCPI